MTDIYRNHAEEVWLTTYLLVGAQQRATPPCRQCHPALWPDLEAVATFPHLMVDVRGSLLIVSQDE